MQAISSTYPSTNEVFRQGWGPLDPFLQSWSFPFMQRWHRPLFEVCTSGHFLMFLYPYTRTCGVYMVFILHVAVFTINGIVHLYFVKLLGISPSRSTGWTSLWLTGGYHSIVWSHHHLIWLLPLWWALDYSNVQVYKHCLTGQLEGTSFCLHELRSWIKFSSQYHTVRWEGSWYLWKDA